MASNSEDISNNLNEIRIVLGFILAEMRRRNEREEAVLAQHEQYGEERA